MKSLLIYSLLFFFPCTALAADKPVDIPFSDMECAAAYESRKKELADLQEEVERREAMVREMEKELDKKIAEWESLRNDLDKKLSRFQEKTSKEFDNLVEVYSTMRGSKAASLLNGMSSENAARILKAMDSEKVADIVPRLDGEKAVEVSRLMGLLK